MFQKGTRTGVLDSCKVKLFRIFHIYGGSARKFAPEGDFIKGSVKANKRRSKLRKGRKSKGMVARTRKTRFRRDGTAINCINHTGVILLRRRRRPRGRKFMGPLIREMKWWRPFYWAIKVI